MRAVFLNQAIKCVHYISYILEELKQCCNLLFICGTAVFLQGINKRTLSHQTADFSCLPVTLLQNSTSAVRILNMLLDATTNVKQETWRLLLTAPASSFKRTKEKNSLRCLGLLTPYDFSFWCTGSDQHYVWLWGSNPELPGGKQVDLPSWLCRQSSDVGRVSSVAGGGSGAGLGLASGTYTDKLTAF